ncbi:MAG TPA: Xaa-Pro peptidase family protein [Verrucomicrobiae bacterium]|nr:Xaa-Pro peptidase family protein [Verrucomicrobiae bacterium]
MNRTENLLIVADSEHDANILYAVGMFVPDPFIFLRIRGRDSVIMSDLEIDRARKEASHCRVLSLGDIQRKLRAAGSKCGFAEVIATVLRQQRVKTISVPSSFPLGLALELQKLGIQLKPKPGTFFAERETKTPAEVKKISAALMMAEVGMAEGIQALKLSKIGKGRRLIYHGAPLTSEKLRSIIDTAILQTCGLANHTIVAGGKQGCDPHEPGHGPLSANEPIILDIFPRSQKTGYFGDITRTVVRGRASESVRKLYDTVLQGQRLAFQKVRAGTKTQEVHQAVQDYFVAQGYKTGKRNGRMEGFFHGTGHGLGLEIHEAPRMGATSTGKLVAGQVVTVEPGLYYPSIGGVRLEDVALVTDRGARNLTRFEKVLEV